jgi:hypothetical protein
METIILIIASLAAGFLVCYIWKFQGYKSRVKKTVGELTYQKIEGKDLPMDYEPTKGGKRT